MEILTIGIAGGTGSGKTSLTNRIMRQFSGEITVLHHDSYYKYQAEPSYEKRAQVNYDHPDAFDNDMLAEHIRRLKNGETVACPVYDFAVHNRSEETETVYPSRVILVEGILIFALPELREQMDLKIFVDSDADVRILRRMVRDVRDRGRSVESVMNQYLDTVKPMHEQFVEPSKRYADIIIPGGGKNPVVVELLTERIRAFLNK